MTAAAIRELAHAVVTASAPESTLAEVQALTRAATDLLRGHPERERVVPDFKMLNIGSGDSATVEDAGLMDRGVGGPMNPLSIDMARRREGDDFVTTVRFGRLFQGPPGRAHGGMIAAVFDEVTGVVLFLAESPGYTVRLDVTYDAPVPLDVPVEFRARLKSVVGRRLVVEAEATLDSVVLARAEATFALVDVRRFNQGSRARSAGSAEPR